jgi:hypothetical protein
MAYNLDWQLKIDEQPIKGGSFLAVVTCELVGDRFQIKLLDESGATNAFKVYSNVNIGGKDYLLLENVSRASSTSTEVVDSTDTTDFTVSTDSTDETLTVVRLFDKTRVCAMDPDRFSSLRNAFLSFLEIGETSSIATLRLLLAGN